jgi:tRNA threonylcarbamoyladenosine biosynthesis protein TsaE
VHQYSAPRSAVFHVDLYRIESPDQLTNIGWDEIVSAHALVIIEWPERAKGALPAHVPIDLEHLPSDPTRRVLLAG